MADGFREITVESIGTAEGLTNLNNMLRILFDNVAGDTETVRIYKDYGSPENAIAAGIGSLYLRLDGGASTTLYVKESGTGDTGWVSK